MHVVGDQKTVIEGKQDVFVGGVRKTRVDAMDELSSPTIHLAADGLLIARSGALTAVTAGSMLVCAAPTIHIGGTAVIVAGKTVDIVGEAKVTVSAPTVFRRPPPVPA